MKFSKYVLGLLSFFVSLNLIAGTFTIAPYSLRKENGENLIKFQVYEDRMLRFTILHDGDNGIIQRVEKQYFHKDILHTLNLGKQDCNSMIKLQIEDITEGKDAVLLENNFHYIPCDANEPIRFGFLSDTQKAEGNDGHSAIAKHVENYIEEKGLS